MKTQPLYPQRHRSTPRLLLDFLLAVAAFAVVIVLTSCGGTFTYVSPIGPVSYTTPQLIKPAIVIPEK